uniref:Putative ovule protein n=1 Tax=Solanum chacoense TaxID=4108 RepID=A0A0V0HEM8_SOLCH
MAVGLVIIALLVVCLQSYSYLMLNYRSTLNKLQKPKKIYLDSVSLYCTCDGKNQNFQIISYTLELFS